MLITLASRCICGEIRSVLSLQRRLIASVSASDTHVLSKKANTAASPQQELATTHADLKTTLEVNYRRLTKDEQDRLAYLYRDENNPYPRHIHHLFPGLSLRSLTYRIRLLKGASKRKRWTPDEIEKLLNLVASGQKMHELLGVFPNRTESAIENMLARWRPRNSLFLEKRTGSEDTKETTGRARDDHRKSSRDDHLHDNDTGTPSSFSSSTTTTLNGFLPWVPMQEPRLPWTEAEDEVLKTLVQKAMDTQPDRWRRELSRLLSDPKERKGLDPSRSFTKSIQRLHKIQSRHFISKKQWTPGEHELLMKAVSSQTGRTLDEKGTRSHTGDDQSEHSSPTDRRQQTEPSATHLESLKEVNWRLVALEVGNKNYVQCKSRFIRFNGNPAKGRWSLKEFELLKQGVAQYGQDWNRIASLVGTRTSVQTRTKYIRLVQNEQEKEHVKK